MNKNLSDISNALENEVLMARALSDMMDIFHTAACGFRKTDLDFENIQNASWLIFKISKYHSEQLLEISNDVFNAFRETDNHSSSNAPV